MLPLLVILGPTAVGKTAVAVKVARRLQGEIISADSMQVYRHLDIGTAKPTRAEQQGVPHHLLDVVDPDEEFNVARFQAEVNALIPQIAARGHLSLLVGGTGLYIRAVVDNYAFGPGGRNPTLRAALQAQAAEVGSAALHAELARVDPEAAARIHPADTRRIIRALEVKTTTGRAISQSGRGLPLYRTLQIGLIRDRARLYAAIDARVDKMLAGGLVEETKWLLEQGYPETLPALQALGYKELIPYLRGLLTLEEAARILKQQTRRFAKRQLTWFRRDRRIIWLNRDNFTSEEALVEEITALAEGKLLQHHE